MKIGMVVKTPIVEMVVTGTKQVTVPCDCESLDDFFEGLFLKQTFPAAADRNIYAAPDPLMQKYEQWKFDHRERLAKLANGTASPMHQHTDQMFKRNPENEKANRTDFSAFVKPCSICGQSKR